MDRVRLGGILPPFTFSSRLKGSLASLEGVGGVAGSGDAGVDWKAR